MDGRCGTHPCGASPLHLKLSRTSVPKIGRIPAGRSANQQEDAPKISQDRYQVSGIMACARDGPHGASAACSFLFMLSSTAAEMQSGHIYLLSISFNYRCVACLLTLRACVLRHVRPDQLQVLCMLRQAQ